MDNLQDTDEDEKSRVLTLLNTLIYRCAMYYEVKNRMVLLRDDGTYSFPVRNFKDHLKLLMKAIEFLDSSEASEQDCPVCLTNYDENTNYAIFDNCTHNCCSSCAERLFQFKRIQERNCPMCREPVNAWTNSNIIRMLT